MTAEILPLAHASVAAHDVPVQMRFTLYAALLVTGVFGCGGETFYAADAGAAGGGALDGFTDASASDAASVSDAANADGASDAKSPTDSASTCPSANDLAVRKCTQTSDCAKVNLGCHCGNQPVVGINRASEAKMRTCEQLRKEACTLECSTESGFVAEDKNVTSDRTKIVLICYEDATAGKTCRTYLPN